MLRFHKPFFFSRLRMTITHAMMITFVAMLMILTPRLFKCFTSPSSDSGWKRDELTSGGLALQTSYS